MQFEPDFTLPLTKTGKSQTVFPPPWYYGVTYIAAHVKLAGVGNLIPEFFRADGEGWVYIAEFISTSEHNWDFMYKEPDLVQYMEAAIGLKVEYEGRNYLYFPFMWVDKDWALVRGWLDGYPKKLANIRMTRLHPLLPKYNKVEPGLRLGGYATRGGGVMVRMEVQLKEKTDSLPLKDFGPLINIRRYPTRGDGEKDVYEVVSRQRDESKYGEIWKGDAKVTLEGYVNDELENVSVQQVYGGYYYPLYFRVSKTILLKRVEKVQVQS
ncbi:acetoacetate decarboxylase family protein [Metallosphaera tengchongensis]|uniref:Acetoacetate decarboxylase family protein n=1 Tax=Metallosphaera tengchongensis TaxID=1532350 RepID=A0A6N0NUY6_9CREN|nr:acetoacetate decarboxylase family protein [Metallosphaera tengchongensis]QKQ99009.1 acetoacetate decarboxylase family protein [Metallosphaera tengchongensis]